MKTALWNKMPYRNPDSDFVPEITQYPAGSPGAVIVFAGGAYSHRAEHEGPVIGEWLQSIGITAFVVDYRIAPEYKHPVMICDAQRAVRYVRSRAEDLGFSPDKIAVMGFSAGGHLAASVSVHYAKKFYDPTDEIDLESAKPNATILGYPVIDMFEYRHDGSRQNLLGSRSSYNDKELMALHKHVSADTPPAFLWHTSADASVPVENTLLYADALAKVCVPFEVHIYPYGSHGLGLANEGERLNPHAAQWTDSLDRWLALMEYKI